MEKIIFVITLFFIASIPFYSHAVPVTSQKKSIHQSVVFSKKQKKRNFFQRIILKKIQRKIDRQARKRNNQKKNKHSSNANKSFLFGLLSILGAIIGIIIVTSTNGIGCILLSFFISALFTLIFGVISLINSIKYFQRNNPSGQLDFEDFKAWFGIVVAAILVGILFVIGFG